MLDKTPRYAEAEDVLLRTGARRIVGHSLGAAIGTRLAETHSQVETGNMYGSPTLTGNPKLHYFRHLGDPISLSSIASADTNFHFGNPHTYRGFGKHYAAPRRRFVRTMF